jgi:NAD(P)-dependent dehydrogenase (short-subunit alcohol dehydrogenase family)
VYSHAQSLDGHTVIVTSASRGVGAAALRSAGVIVDTAIARFDALTGLVNNAIWIKNHTPFAEQDDFAHTFDTGPRAAFHPMKGGLPTPEDGRWGIHRQPRLRGQHRR